MGTVDLSAQAQVFNYAAPGHSMLNRINNDTGGASGFTGDMFSLIKTGVSTYVCYMSENEGTTWPFNLFTLSRANVQEFGSIHLNSDGFMHIIYRVYESGQDRIFFRRANVTNNFQLGTEIHLSSQTAASAGLVYQGCDIQTARSGSNHYVVAAIGHTNGATTGVTLAGGTIDGASAWHLNSAGTISGTRAWYETGSGRVTPHLDLEHTGDGVSANPANVWLSWNGPGRAAPRLVKLPWAGSGWTGSSSSIHIADGVPAQDWITGRWTGSEFIIASVSPGNTSQVILYERNKANTTTTIRSTSPTHTTGVIRSLGFASKHDNRDIRCYAVGTSTAVVYYIDWIRATNTWTSWATVDATAVIGTTPAFQYSMRRTSYGNGKMDYIGGYATPIQRTTHQSLSYVPNTPTWQFGTAANVPPSNGAAMSTASSLVLDWNYSHPDPLQVQASYQIQRQVGALAIEWWNAGGSVWQAGAVDNATATSQLTLTATQAWSDGNATNDTDPNHVYKVRVKDATGAQSALSDALTLIPSAIVNPAITAPTAASTQTSASVTVTWTAAQQSAYQLKARLTATPGVYLWDSGKVSSALLSVPIGVALADGADITVELNTWNTEGLISATQSRQFFVAYVPPPAGTCASLAIPASGIIRVTITNPAPVGSQPAFSTQDLYRRPALGGNLITNSGFEVNTTGWTNPGLTSLTRSLTQFKGGVASARCVPTGVAADSFGESALVTIDPTLTYTVEGWIRPDTVNKPAKIQIRWYTAANAFISATTLSRVTTGSATAWLFMQVSADASLVPTAAKATVALGESTTPAAGDAFYIDDLYLYPANTDPGVPVQIALPTGAIYDDWQPWSGTLFEYRTVVMGANATTTNGPWTT